MTRTTPELAPPSQNFHATPTGGRLTTTYDLTCNRPHTQRIFSGIGFRAWNHPAPKSRPYHEATAATHPCLDIWRIATMITPRSPGKEMSNLLSRNHIMAYPITNFWLWDSLKKIVYCECG
ncbi:hypothetical protein AVEN_125665-1 [Araneus ventricosus]|uniref:Uncharacterized protein n=1 Tax=Araneus ventricosus TaxID=182803 RepID=A0A4Y2J4L7_ARAVE|nr:hypothetical protein AVEN_125665-1 [Araneus ventricosus]